MAKRVNEQEIMFYNRKFYSNAKGFSQFEFINADIVEKIKNKVMELLPERLYPKNSDKRYLQALKYLTDPKTKKVCDSFDEQILFLILAIDPDLTIYSYFLNNGYSLRESEEIRRSKANALVDFIMTRVGYFDPEFIKFEEVFFLKYLKNGDVMSHVNKDCSTFLDVLMTISSFKDVSESEYNFILKKAEYYFTVCEDPKSVTTLCFNVNNPNSVLELYSTPYKIIFLIMVIDPDLMALKIYEEESNEERIKERTIQALGFFHEGLAKAEEAYRRRFCPERNVSDWSLN